jgi:hypothetical protein
VLLKAGKDGDILLKAEGQMINLDLFESVSIYSALVGDE